MSPPELVQNITTTEATVELSLADPFSNSFEIWTLLVVAGLALMMLVLVVLLNILFYQTAGKKEEKLEAIFPLDEPHNLLDW